MLNKTVKKLKKNKKATKLFGCFLAPPVGFEPTTCRLTAECSTAELKRQKAMFLRIATNWQFAIVCALQTIREGRNCLRV